MALPHVHGSASGQIAHNSIFDTGITPGSTLGKFIGFGEEGTTAVANRTHWALSENIDYVYQIMAADRALPAGASWVVPGGGSSTFQFTGDVWVGDAGYPAIEDEGLLVLFSVLDDQYNELTDGAGNEVRVAVVRDTTNVTNAYKAGFETDAVITFRTVDPTTGVDVINPYTVPAATDVRILYAEKGNLEALPVDSFIKFKVHSGAEVEAGVLLQDGTRAMTGNLDLATNDLINVGQVLSASPMTVRATNELHLQGDTELDIKDQHLASAVPWSQAGTAALYQPTASINPSVVGSLSSQARISEALTFNRSVDKASSFSPFASNTVAYPALNLFMNGEYVVIPAGSAVAGAGAGTYYMYVRSDTLAVVLETSVAAVPVGSVAVWEGAWDGGVIWSLPFDLRWPSTKRGNTVSIYVGDQAGADFSDIDEAFLYAGRAPFSNRQALAFEIVVVGTATAADTLNLRQGWTLRGLDYQGVGTSVYPSVITTTAAFPTTSDVISAEAHCVIKNLRLRWGNTSANQNVANYAITTGVHCLIENLRIDTSTAFLLGNGIKLISTITKPGSVVRLCQFLAWEGYAVVATGSARNTIELCGFSPTTSSTGVIDFSSTGFTGDATAQLNVVRGCKFLGTTNTRYIYAGGPNILIENCEGVLTGSPAQSAPFIELMSGHASQLRGGVTLRNCFLSVGYRVIQSAINNSNLRLHVIAEGNYITDFSDTAFNIDNTAVDTASSVVVRDNHIDDIGGYVGYFNNAQSVFFLGNKIESNVTVGFGLLGTTVAVIDGNHFEGWIAANFLEFISGGGAGSRIVNNYFGTISSPTNGAIIKLTADDVIIANNRFDTSGVLVDVGILVEDCLNCQISNNHFDKFDLNCLRIYNAADVDEDGGHVVSGNIIKGTSTNGIHLFVFGFRDVVISGNRFGDVAVRANGTAIFINDNTTAKADGANIVGNIFEGVIGDGPTADAAIVEMVSTFGSIEGNYFHACGDTINAPIGNYTIIAGARASVVGNYFKDTYGPQNAGATTRIIFVGHNVSGNFIHHEFNRTTHPNGPLGTIYGIDLASGALVNNNHVFFVGSDTGTVPSPTIAIRAVTGANSQVCSNRINDWSCGGGETAILIPGTNVVAVGNLSIIHNIDFTGGSGGMVLGNVVTATGSTIPAGHQTATNK